MDRDRVKATLRAHEAELKSAGILSLSLFGSVARGEKGNDVDLMAEFDTTKRLTLVDMAGLENRLAELLGVKVDLALAKSMKEPIRQHAAREAVFVF